MQKVEEKEKPKTTTQTTKLDVPELKKTEVVQKVSVMSLSRLERNFFLFFSFCFEERFFFFSL